MKPSMSIHNALDGARMAAVTCYLSVQSCKVSDTLRKLTVLDQSRMTLDVCEYHSNRGYCVDVCVCVFDCPGHFQHTGQGRAACGADH